MLDRLLNELGFVQPIAEVKTAVKLVRGRGLSRPLD